MPTISLAGGFDAGPLTGHASLRYTVPLPAGLDAGPLASYARLRDPARYRRAQCASAPADVMVTALEIRHPAIAEPVRVVDDGQDHTIEGARYVGLRFTARLAGDVQGQAPQAELVIDNIGRALTQWIEAADGGAGATVRVMRLVAGDAAPEWEMTMDVESMSMDQERITARLGFDPLLGRNAVTPRHDPQTSPGLF